MLKSISKKYWIFLFFLLTAIVITIPAFMDSYFKLTMDGAIFISRMESIHSAFSNFRIPALTNFIGIANHGNAFNAMYPWLTAGLFFELPRLIIRNPFSAFFVSYVLLSLVTLLNAYALVNKLSQNTIVKVFACLFYELNAYHLTLLFSRESLGEAISYTFFPLVILGCLKIWQKEKNGIFVLALSMGLLANTHVLSLLIAFLMLLIMEVIRIIQRRITWKEVLWFAISAVIGALSAIYSLTNIVRIGLTNDLHTPFRALMPVVPSKMIQAVLDNSIQDNSYIFNIGLIGLGILLFFFLKSFVSKGRQTWKGWCLAAGFIFIGTTPWVSIVGLDQTFLGNIQFLGRLLSLVVLFLTIGLVLYFEESQLSISILVNITISVLLFSMGMNSIYNYHMLRNDSPTRYYVSKTNFVQTAHTENKGVGMTDYSLVNSKNSDQALMNKANNKMMSYRGTFNSASFKVDMSKKGTAILPFNLYKGISYKIFVDKKIVKVKKGILKLSLSKGVHKIRIYAKGNISEYITFAISVLVSVLAVAAVIFYRKID